MPGFFLKHFPELPGKHLFRSLFFHKVVGRRPGTYSRDSNAGVFLLTGKHFFNRTPSVDRVPLKKFKKILSTVSSPSFTVHNPTSKDVFYTACLLYEAMYRVVYDGDN